MKAILTWISKVIILLLGMGILFFSPKIALITFNINYSSSSSVTWAVFTTQIYTFSSALTQMIGLLGIALIVLSLILMFRKNN
jgi:hypothetical protein